MLLRLSDLQSMADWNRNSAAQMMHRLIDILRVVEIDGATTTDAALSDRTTFLSSDKGSSSGEQCAVI